MFKFNFVETSIAEDDSSGAKHAPMSTGQEKVISGIYDVCLLLEEAVTVIGEAVPCPDLELYKRSLSDVKMEIAQNDDQFDNLRQLVLDQNTDLVKGVYEGGLKTWECSLDMIDWLYEWLIANPHINISSKTVLELGCGSAIPSLYLLRRAQNQPPSNENSKHSLGHLTLQDYNSQVLQLVTIPNILLNTDQGSLFAHNNVDQNGCFEREINFSECTELPHISFVYGDWADLKNSLLSCNNGVSYDLVLTSETIYDIESIGHLLNLIRNTMARPDGIAFVAAKTFYFGVGGGLRRFEELVQEQNKNESEYQQLCCTVVKVFADCSVRREVLELRWLTT